MTLSVIFIPEWMVQMSLYLPVFLNFFVKLTPRLEVVSEAKLGSARSYLLQAVREAWETPAGGEAASLGQRAILKLAGVHAAHQARDVLDTVYHAAGATAIFEDNPFERRLRDIHTVMQQVQAHYANFELIGQVLLGMPSPTKLI